VSSPFDIRPASNSAFAPRKEVMNVREQFIAYLHDHGWTLDTTATLPRRHSNERVQNPLAFVRPAQAGGDWHLHLDYMIESSYTGRTDNTLRGLEMWRIKPGQVRGDAPAIHKLRQPKKYGDTGLWTIAGRDLGNDYGKAMRMRAERVTADPDLAVWLEVEQRWKDNEAMKQAQIAREAAWAKRKQATPHVLVTGSAWTGLTDAVTRAARKLYQADGTSDTYALMDALRTAVAELEAAVEKQP